MFYPYKHFLKTLKQINLQKKVRIINRFQLNLTLIVFVTKPLKIGSWVSLRFWSAFNRPFILTVNLFARYYQVLMVDKVDKLCQSFLLLWEKKSNQVNGNSRASVPITYALIGPRWFWFCPAQHQLMICHSAGIIAAMFCHWLSRRRHTIFFFYYLKFIQIFFGW